MAGPFPRPPLVGLQVSRFSLQEKPEGRGWRLIFYLSYPPGSSVNAGIPKSVRTVNFVSFSDVIRAIVGVGRGARLASLPPCPREGRGQVFAGSHVGRNVLCGSDPEFRSSLGLLVRFSPR